jgi:hypothetical protein
MDAPDLLALARNPARHGALEQRHGRSIAEIIASRAVVIRHAVQLAARPHSAYRTIHATQLAFADSSSNSAVQHQSAR